MNQELSISQNRLKNRHLHCIQCDTMLDVRDFKPLDPIMCPKCKMEMVVPAKLGPYDLYKFLGEGSMGRVYQAKDPSLERDVAVKILREDFNATPSMWRMLEDEARTAAGITHSNVIHIFTMGKILGRPYIVMELADFASLEDLLHQGKVTEKLAIQVAIDVMSGLEVAYKKSLIHGDIKPGNILITQKGRAKITDFGLARFLTQGQEVECWGTPYYIAPEKYQQISEDFRSDMYSLGATLFHAMCGHAPFEGKTGEEVTQKSLKLPTPHLHKETENVSMEFSELIWKMMRKDPDKRFLSYAQAITCFEKLQDGTYELGMCKNLPKGSHQKRKKTNKLMQRLKKLVVDEA